MGNWFLLIAVIDKLEVFAWQWYGGESTAARTALVERMPAPRWSSATTTGIASTVRRTWPETKIQRCPFHVQANIRRRLTLNPRTDAGRRLRTLSLDPSDVREPEDVITARLMIEAWWHS